MSETAVISVESREDMLLAKVEKRTLNDQFTQVLVDELLTAAAAAPSVPIVVDMGKVKFAPSVALGALVQLTKSLRLDNRRIVLVNIDTRVLEAINVTGLQNILEIYRSVDEMPRRAP
jgi:anti-anti-sigma factor